MHHPKTLTRLSTPTADSYWPQTGDWLQYKDGDWCLVRGSGVAEERHHYSISSPKLNLTDRLSFKTREHLADFYPRHVGVGKLLQELEDKRGTS